MMRHRAPAVRAGFLALILAGSGCGAILGLDEFEAASAPGSQNTGGDGGADACSPDATERCYSGPAKTEGVGLCRSGLRTCDGSGEMWGACQDEVVPAQESCASTEDENCDGFDCGLWARTAETPNVKASINSIAIDKQENIIFAGAFTNSIQFGAEPLVGYERNEPSALDAFVVSLDSAGNHRWSRQFSDAMNQEATSVCVDSIGNIIVAGVNSGSINLGGSDLGPGIYVAKFDSDGKHIWSRGFSKPPADDSSFLPGRPKVKSTPNNDVIIAGNFAGIIQFDDTTFATYPADTFDLYITRIDGETGSSRAADGGWAQQFRSEGNDTLDGIAVHSSNNIIATGTFSQRIEFGNISPTTDDGMFLVNIDRTGTPTWARAFANAQPTALSVDTLGNISVTGAYEHPTDFGGGVLPEWSQMAFATQFDIAGNHRWSRGFQGNITTSGISTDAMNSVVILATIRHEVRIDDSEILYADEFPSPMAFKLDPEGRTSWKRWFPFRPYGAGEAGTAATTPNGETVISGDGSTTGGQSPAIDFGTGPQPIGEYSLFIAKLGK